MFGNSTRLNILHLRASNFYGGPERQLHFHAIQARTYNYGITIGSFLEAGKTPELLEIAARDSIDTFCLDVKSGYDLRAVNRLRRYLRSRDTDALCTHDYRSQVVGFFARRGTRAKWISFSRGFTAENLKVRLYQWIERLVVRFADHIVAVSESQKRKLLDLGIPDSKITVIHNAIDSGVLEDVDPVDLRREFKLPRETVICVAAGRFSSEKGQLYLVRAAANAIRSNPRLRFILYGDGPDLERTRATVRELELGEKVICPGFEKKILGCIKGADILINPSLSEGLPNVVLEAMSLGVPVIATSVGGVPEMIDPGKSGVLVPPGDEAALAQAINDLVEHWPLKDKIVENARTTVREKFSFENQTLRLSRVYELVSGKKVAVSD